MSYRLLRDGGSYEIYIDSDGGGQTRLTTAPQGRVGAQHCSSWDAVARTARLNSGVEVSCARFSSIESGTQLEESLFGKSLCCPAATLLLSCHTMVTRWSCLSSVVANVAVKIDTFNNILLCLVRTELLELKKHDVPYGGCYAIIDNDVSV